MPKFLNNVNLNKNELQNAKIQALASAPSSPVEGQIYFNSTVGDKRIYVWTGTAWKTVSGTFVNADIDAGAAIVYSKLSLSNSIVAGDITTGAVTSDKILDGTITNVDINASAAIAFEKLASPVSSFAFNSQKITGLADPTSAQDAATKAYVDAARSGLDVKASVRAATTANITLSGTQTIDGISVIAGDRILVKDQSTSSANGIYDVAAGAWSRSSDADISAEVTTGMFTFVSEGTVNADSGYVLTTDDTITLGSTSLTFVQFSGAGQVTAGAGLTKSGNTIDVIGTAGRITVNANDVDIASTYIGQSSITTLGTITTGIWNGTDVAVADGGTGASTAAGAKTNLGFMTRYATTFGDGSTLDYTITHSLNTQDVHVSVYEVSSTIMVIPDMEVTGSNTITLRFAVAPTTNQYRVVVIG
jgi:hypothetical protein